MKDNAYNVPDEEKADMEFREKEKCLENGESDNGSRRAPKETRKSTRLADLSQQAKTITSNKATLAIILLCILLFVFFIIIIALSVQVGRLYTSDTTELCTSPECLRSAAHVAAKLNSTFNPCDNFWEYACGGWLQKHQLPHKRGSLSVLGQVKEKVEWKLRHQIDIIPDSSDIRSAEAKVKDFYTECNNVKQADYMTLPKLKSKINELGGWNLLNNWSPQRWRRENVLTRLHTEFGINAYFRVTVEPDDLDRERNIIKIFPSGLTLPSKHFYNNNPNNTYPARFKRFLDEFARELGATQEQAHEFSNNMVEYERRLAEISPPPEAYRQPERFYRKLTVQELNTLAPTLPWLDILQKLYPSAKATDTTEIAIFDEVYFTKLSDTLTSSTNIIVHHYFMLRLSLHFGPHLKEVFRKLTNEFYQALEGAKNVNEMAQDRWQYCLDLTNKYFGQVLGAMYVKMYYIPEFNDESKVVESKIIETFKDNVGYIPWADDSKTYDKIRGKLDKMVTLRGAPDFIFNHDALSTYYNDFIVQADFFENIVSGEQFLRKKEEALLTKQVNSESGWTLSPHEVESIYQYHGNHLVIPAGLLQLPIFDPVSTNAVKFGSLGTILGSQMFKAFDEKGVLYNEFGALDPWLHGKSEKSYNRAATCLREKLGNETLFGNIHVNGKLVLGETIADLAAVKFAYKAYKSSTKEHDDLPGLSVNSDELFFIAYAQSMCQIISPEKVRTLNEHSTNSPNQIRVLRALQQLPEFSEVFDCPSSSIMNPHNKCSIW